jgi:hypothetical protein
MSGVGGLFSTDTPNPTVYGSVTEEGLALRPVPGIRRPKWVELPTQTSTL